MTLHPLLGALISFIICAALAPIVRKLCLRYDAVDRPGPLKIHATPIPRLGGVAVFASIVAGFLFSENQDSRAGAFFLAAFAVVWIVGVADDLRDISPYTRLVGQTTAGMILWFGGWRFPALGALAHSSGVNLLFLTVAVVTFANAFNFLDGSDGIVSGVSAIIGVAYVVISRSTAVHGLTSSLAGCLAGSCAGFLPYNWPRASIYLGDSGSTILGFCAALLALVPPTSVHEPTLFAFTPLILAGLPLVDAILAPIRRLRSGASLVLGDRGHVYDRMIARGWSSRRVALVCYAITAVLGVAAWSGVQFENGGLLVAGLASLAGLMVLAAWLGVLQTERQEIRSESALNFSSGQQAERPS